MMEEIPPAVQFQPLLRLVESGVRSGPTERTPPPLEN